jgi:catechol 2,3-dioxygenase-like lactoylglutathione lyase family enzyme
MPTSVRFYRDKLGFTVKMTSPSLGGEDRFHWCLLELGETQLMLNTAYEFDDERPVPRDPRRTAAHDDTCVYFSCPDVDAAYEEFRSRGIALDRPKVAPYGMKQLYFHDPDGFGLCFQWAAESAEVA